MKFFHVDHLQYTKIQGIISRASQETTFRVHFHVPMMFYYVRFMHDMHFPQSTRHTTASPKNPSTQHTTASPKNPSPQHTTASPKKNPSACQARLRRDRVLSIPIFHGLITQLYIYISSFVYYLDTYDTFCIAGSGCRQTSRSCVTYMNLTQPGELFVLARQLPGNFQIFLSRDCT